MSYSQLNQICSLFPDMDTKSIQEMLALNNNDTEKTIAAIMVTREGIEGLLGDDAVPEKPTTTTTGGQSSGEKEDNSDKWACEACTFLNSHFSPNCSVCGSPSPLFKGQLAAPVPKSVIVPLWWASFWAEYGSQTCTSEEDAKNLVFHQSADFRDVNTLTVEVKRKLCKLLDLDEVHAGPAPDDTILQPAPGGGRRIKPGFRAGRITKK